MVTITRDKDPTKAELMAAQMYNSVFMATQTYALQQRTRLPLLQEGLLNNRRLSGGHPSLLLSHLKVLTRKNAALLHHCLKQVSIRETIVLHQ